MEFDGIEPIWTISPVSPILHHGPTGESYERNSPEAHWADGLGQVVPHHAAEPEPAYGAEPAAIYEPSQGPAAATVLTDAAGIYDSHGHRATDAA